MDDIKIRYLKCIEIGKDPAWRMWRMHIVSYLDVNLSTLYPEITTWFTLDIVKDDNHVIFILKDSVIIGICILDMTKVKIATLYISEGYRRKGLGTMILKEALGIFKISTDKLPYININKGIAHRVRPFLKRHNAKCISNLGNKEKWEVSDESI